MGRLGLRQAAIKLERFEAQISSNNVRKMRLRQVATTLERFEAQRSSNNVGEISGSEK